jgi:hypothetical protein
MPRRELRSLLFLAAVAALWMLTQGVAGLDSAWLTMAPAVLIAVPLVGGRYLGERVLERVAGRAPAPRRRTATQPARLRPARIAPRRGGLLLGLRLAERGPPASAAAG